MIKKPDDASASIMVFIVNTALVCTSIKVITKYMNICSTDDCITYIASSNLQ